jgi:hypothetical protein
VKDFALWMAVRQAFLRVTCWIETQSEITEFQVILRGSLLGVVSEIEKQFCMQPRVRQDITATVKYRDVKEKVNGRKKRVKEMQK